MTVSIRVKQGDTFKLTNQGLVDNVAQDMTGWQINSQIRDDDGNLIESLTAAWVDQTAGTYQLSGSDTSVWPAGDLRCDIQYTTNTGDVISTETFIVTVFKDITQ